MRYDIKANTLRPVPRAVLMLGITAMLTACGGAQEGSAVVATQDASAVSRPLAAVVTRSAGVIINEVMTANHAGLADSDGDRKDWVELYNTTAAAIDLSGWGLSNKPNSPFRWVFPVGTTIAAKGHLRVWMSQKDRTTSVSALHTNFNVDNGADDVVLTAPEGTTTGFRADMTTPALSRPDVSWCRMPSGSISSPFVHCLTPTPGAANSGTTASSMVVQPALSLASGVYGTPQTVTVTGPAGATLRYTTDGSEPTATSPVVTGPVLVSTSSVLRAAAFVTGQLPSLISTATYVIDAAGTFDAQRRLFITMSPSDTSSFRAGGATTTGWRGHVAMVEGTGAVAFAGGALVSESGQIGSRSGQHTLPIDIKFSDVVANKSISYPVFGVKPNVVSFKKLRVRNAGSDYWDAHLRDQYWQSILDNGQAPYSAYEPVQVFLNGQYYGAMDLREKEDENLVESTYGVDKDLVQFLSDSEVKNGENTTADFNTMSDFIRLNNMAVAANYERAKTLLDMENFAHDFALHMFAVSPDWLWRNMHVFRMPDYDGKWRYRPHDFDISADLPPRFFASPVTRDMNSFYGNYSGGQIMNSLLANADFRNLYINIIADQLNSVATPARLNARLDTMAAQIRPYLPAHYARNSGSGSVANWTAQVTRLRNFLNAREAIYVGHTQAKFALTARKSLQVSVNDPAMGTVKVNTIDLTGTLTAAAPLWTGRYFPEVPVTLVAKPKPGYVFVGWQGAATGTAASLSQRITVDGTGFHAVFAPEATVAAPQIDAIAAQNVETGKWLTLQVKASDVRGHKLTYTAKTLPSGLNLHPVTGLISGKPTRGGTFATVITVTNGRSAATLPVSWTVAVQGNRVVNIPTVISGDGTGLVGSYFNNATFTGTPALTRTELPAINLGAGAGPVAGFGTSGWAVRWDGMLSAPVAGNYTIRTTNLTDDGVRVWVGGTLLIDNWTTPSAASRQAVVTLGANVPVPIRVELRDQSGSARLTLDWMAPWDSTFQPMALGVFTPQ
jgi:uncharacterized repeat protein (TIGR02543 family)